MIPNARETVAGRSIGKPERKNKEMGRADMCPVSDAL